MSIWKIMPLYVKIGWDFQIGRVWQKLKCVCGRLRIIDDKLPSLMFGKHEQNWIKIHCKLGRNVLKT